MAKLVIWPASAQHVHGRAASRGKARAKGGDKGSGKGFKGYMKGGFKGKGKDSGKGKGKGKGKYGNAKGFDGKGGKGLWIPRHLLDLRDRGTQVQRMPALGDVCGGRRRRRSGGGSWRCVVGGWSRRRPRTSDPEIGCGGGPGDGERQKVPE